MASGKFIASIHTDYLPFVSLASDAELAQFVRAQIRQANGEDVPELTGVAKALFDTHTALIERLEESSRKKSEAGKRGGNPALIQASPMVKRRLSKAKAVDKPITDTVTVTISDTNTDSQGQEKKVQSPLRKKIYDLFSGITVTDDATTAHNEIVVWLESNGFNCKKEYPVADRGDGYGGRIDIFATRGDEMLAIEIDRITPRQKSITKLLQTEDCAKVILLRGGRETDTDGEIIVLPILLKQQLSANDKPADENVACAAAWVEWMSDRGKAEKPPPALPNDFGEPVRSALCDWLRYKKERREKYVPTGLARHFSIVRNQVKKHGEKAVADLMNYCMGRGWRGVIWDKINSPEAAAASAEEETRVNGADKEMLPDVPVDVGKMTEDEKWESLNRPPGAARTPTH